MQFDRGAVKYFQRRTSTKSQKTKGEGDWMRKLQRTSKCVECGGHVPPYQKFLCEDCWREALNAKLEADDARTADGKDKKNKK